MTLRSKRLVGVTRELQTIPIPAPPPDDAGEPEEDVGEGIDELIKASTYCVFLFFSPPTPVFN